MRAAPVPNRNEEQATTARITARRETRRELHIAWHRRRRCETDRRCFPQVQRRPSFRKNTDRPAVMPMADTMRADRSAGVAAGRVSLTEHSAQIGFENCRRVL